VYYKILIINNITVFTVKQLRVKSKQNCYNAEKLLSIVAPSGEQELTKNYNVNTFSFVAFCCLYVQKFLDSFICY